MLLKNKIMVHQIVYHKNMEIVNIFYQNYLSFIF